MHFTTEPVHGKTNNLGFRTGLTQIRLYSHRRWLESSNFGFKKKRNRTICVAKTKALISFAVTAKLICAFVFAYAICWFSHAQAQFLCQGLSNGTFFLSFFFFCFKERTKRAHYLFFLLPEPYLVEKKMVGNDQAPML